MVVVGTFNAVRASQTPTALNALSVLFTLTNGKGQYDVWLEIEHEQSGDIIWRTGGPLRVEDPLMIVDIHVRIVNLALPAAGKYWVSVKSDGRILQQRPFVVECERSEP